MLLTYNETAKRIEAGESLHIAGSEALLRKLPKGNWIGGSTEYFMSRSGCKTADDALSVLSFHDAEVSIGTYDEKNIHTMTLDAFGQIAYHLVNQSLVYVDVRDLDYERSNAG